MRLICFQEIVSPVACRSEAGTRAIRLTDDGQVRRDLSCRPNPAGKSNTNEKVQIFSAMLGEQIDGGNYEAAMRVLERWWTSASGPGLRI